MTEDDLRVAMLVSGVGIVVWRVADDRIELDEQALRLFGVPRNAFGGRLLHLLKRVREDTRDAFAQALERTVTDGGALAVEVAVDRPSGIARGLQLRGTAVHDSDGATERIVIGVRDASELHDLRFELTASRRMADSREDENRRTRAASEALASSRAQLVTHLSSEVRARIYTVLGMTRLLSDATLAPEQRERLGTIRTAGDELLAFATDIVDVSTSDTAPGSDDDELTAIVPRTLLAEALAAAAESARGRRLELRLDVDAAVPATVSADAHRVERIVYHLLQHAIESALPGELVVTARATMLQSSLHELAIELPAGTPGTTTGWTIATRLAERIGRVAIEDGRVRFTMSVDELAAEPEAPIPIDPLLGVRHPLRILVAEDNAVNRRIIAAFLSKLGYRAQLMIDGREAIAAVDREDLDLVLMDINMPDVDGLEATREIRRRKPFGGPRIVALTANALARDRAACIAAGCNEYVTKPITLEKLARVLVRCPITPPLRPDPDAIDEAVVGKLRAAVGEELFTEVLAVHLGDARELATALQTALDQSDAIALVRIARTLAMTSTALGAKPLGAACLEVEARALRMELARTGEVVTIVAHQVAQIRATLDARFPRVG